MINNVQMIDLHHLSLWLSKHQKQCRNDVQNNRGKIEQQKIRYPQTDFVELSNKKMK